MGCVKYINLTEYPRQGTHLGKSVEVCFYYDASKTIDGKIIRDDAETPFKTIIQLTDGRVLEAGECQYSIKREVANDNE